VRSSASPHLTPNFQLLPAMAIHSEPGGGGALALRPSHSSSHHHYHGGASSVISARTSQSHRARRYNRSLSGAGGGGGTSAYAPQNEFPIFGNSGDVEIVVRVPSGHENRYLLHRHTLTRCSGFFEASTSELWSRGGGTAEGGGSGRASASGGKALTAGNELARIGEDGASEVGTGRKDSAPATPASNSRVSSPRRRWRYELDPGVGPDDVPMLIQKDDEPSPPSAGSLTSASSIFGGPQKQSFHSHRLSKSISSTYAHNSAGFRSHANLSLTSPSSQPPPLPPPTLSEQDLLRDYDNLFRIMYNYPPLLDGLNIADAYVQCKTLLQLADQYDALAVVGPRVDHHLLQFQSRLWKQIAKYPISYLRLGYLSRSKVIFQEALIHVVGQWPAGERSLRAALPDSVLDVIEDKVDELEEAVARVEARLFRLGLVTRSGERVTPATGYLEWLAMSLFRQWLADNTMPSLPPMPMPVPDRRVSFNPAPARGRAVSNPGDRRDSMSNGRPGANISPNVVPPSPLASLGRTYRILGGSPSAPNYLGHDECKRFLKLTPELYSRDNLRRFEKRVEEMKSMAREVVRPLMGSALELETSGGGRNADGSTVKGIGADGLGYLTCTRLLDRDVPWPVDD
jgi:hypothetical protein